MVLLSFVEHFRPTPCRTNRRKGDEVLVDEDTGTEMKFSGERALKNYLASHPNFVKKYSELIINHISKTKTTLNLVDEATLKEIFDQEAALCPTEMTAAQALAADGVDNE